MSTTYQTEDLDEQDGDLGIIDISDLSIRMNALDAAVRTFGSVSDYTLVLKAASAYYNFLTATPPKKDIDDGTRQ